MSDMEKLNSEEILKECKEISAKHGEYSDVAYRAILESKVIELANACNVLIEMENRRHEEYMKRLDSGEPF